MKTSAVWAIFSTVLVLGFAGARCGVGIQYDRNVDGHLKRAADASTIDTAAAELDVAISYLEKHDLTSGYTSVLYQSPPDDIGFWYKNLKSTREELAKVKPETPQMERTNILMKLRETLLDHGQHGDSVTSPDGIEIYPANVPWAFAGWSLLLFMGLSVGIWFWPIAIGRD